MNTQVATPIRRRRAHWATALATTAALAVGPAVFVATPAFAAPLSVTTPAEGSTGNGAFVTFTGLGTAGNTITITYPGVGGTVEAGAGQVEAAPAENYEILAGFTDLTPGLTTVSATITETAAATENPDGSLTPGAVVGTPIVRTFSFAVAPNPAIPFVVNSPAAGETVDTATPTFQGTGTPGETVTIEYTNASGEDSIAGTGLIAVDGSFSIPTTFADLPAGAVEVRTISSAAGADGTPSDQPNVFTSFFFMTAPVPAFVPNPGAIDIVPASVTVSGSKSTGVQVSATGFGQGEDLVITLTAPDGSSTELFSDAGFFSDSTGSYADALVLTGNVAVGTYTVTITGATSGVVLSDTFSVIADPRPAGSGGAELAATGPDDIFTQGLLALAVLMTLAGVALVSRRRIQALITAN